MAATEKAAATLLGRYIQAELDSQGMSVRAAAARGGMAESSFRFYITRWEGKTVPAVEKLQGIADALGVHPVRVNQLAMQDAQIDPPDGLNADQATVVAAMTEMSENLQRTIADIVLRLAEEFRSDDPG